MNDLIFIDGVILIPAALVGLIVAIVLLIKRKKKNGVRPPYAKPFLVAAILLFVYAGVAIVVIPVIYFAYMLLTVGETFIYSALKSI